MDLGQTSGIWPTVARDLPAGIERLATGVVDAGGGQLSAHDLGALAAHPAGRDLLAAVSCGSVSMGALTYIGSGPNFVVKAIAEQHHVRMPGLFGYLVCSVGTLVPVLVAVSALVF
ncbi:MAG TPA: sodium:proton antiporter [Kofleriaceae bacterium]